MVKFTYEFFYVCFEHHARYKKIAIPWFSAIAMVVSSFCLTILTILMIVDLLKPLISLFDSSPSEAGKFGKGPVYLFSILLSGIIFYICHYLIFKSGGASKETGRSDRFYFEPTKRDKLFYWCVFILPYVGVIVTSVLK